MKTLVGFALVSLLLSSAAVGQDDSAPNFIIIFADDQGYGDLGCFGSPEIEMSKNETISAAAAITAGKIIPTLYTPKTGTTNIDVPQIYDFRRI